MKTKTISRGKQLTELANSLELKADSLHPCDANLPRHAYLMERVTNLRKIVRNMR